MIDWKVVAVLCAVSAVAGGLVEQAFVRSSVTTSSVVKKEVVVDAVRVVKRAGKRTVSKVVRTEPDGTKVESEKTVDVLPSVEKEGVVVVVEKEERSKTVVVSGGGGGVVPRWSLGVSVVKPWDDLEAQPQFVPEAGVRVLGGMWGTFGFNAVKQELSLGVRYEF